MAKVLIRHPKSGEEYQVELADFRKRKLYQKAPDADLQTYEAAGFEVVSYADGAVYEPPAPKAEAKG